jgi:hypothetical protein
VAPSRNHPKTKLREIRMKNAKVSYTIVLCVLCAGAGVSFAQDAAKSQAGATAEPTTSLPTSFKGEWIGPADNFRQVSHVLELQITSQSPDGKVTGEYSRFVRAQGSPQTLCIKADHLPAEGTYDGKKLTIRVKGSQNSATCNDYTLTFVRGKDHYFERKIENGSSYLDPVK